MSEKLPEGWVETRLGEVVTITSSKRIFHSDYVTSGIPFYRSKEIIEKQKGNNVSTELFITKEIFAEIKSKFGAPQKDDLLLTSVGTLGIPYLVQNDEVFYFKDGNLTWFRGYKELIPKFIYYFFLSSVGKERLKEITIGSTQSALTIAGLKTISLFLPPLPEQKAIAAVLSAFDDKIELLREQNQTLETLAQTIFKEWFVHFNYPDQNGKPYRDNGGEMVDSELGKIPKGWRVGDLLDIFELIGGGTPKTTNKEYWNGEIPWYSVVDAPNANDVFVIHTEKYITERGLSESSTKLLKRGTSIVSARGTVGKLAIVGVDMAMNQSCYGIKGKDYWGDYFVYFQVKEILSNLKRNVHGAVFDTITKSTFKHVFIPISDEEFVVIFEKRIRPIMEKIFNNVSQIQTLSKICDTLLPKLMSGQLRVSV